MSRMTTGSPSIAAKMPSKSPCWSDLELGHRGVERGDGLGLVGRRASRRRRRLALARVAAFATRIAPRTISSRVALAEHVLGPAEADALRAVAAGLRGLLGLVGVGPDLHAADLVGPAEELLELGLVLEAGLDGRQRAEVERSPVEPSRLTQSPSLNVGPVTWQCALLARVVDQQVGAAGDARLADLARDDRGMRGRAAAGGDDALRPRPCRGSRRARSRSGRG